VKHDIISTDPNGPAQSRHPNHNKVPLPLRKTSKPRTKKMFHTIWPPDPKGETHYLPHELGHGAVKKQMLDRLGHTTETTFSTPPFHFLFARLSLVNTTPFLRYQRKILIFNGNLALQAPHSTGVPNVKTKLSYKSLTENFLLAVQTKVSLRLLRFTSRTLPTSWTCLRFMIEKSCWNKK
jgi:hypothetical protein